MAVVILSSFGLKFPIISTIHILSIKATCKTGEIFLNSPKTYKTLYGSSLTRSTQQASSDAARKMQNDADESWGSTKQTTRWGRNLKRRGGEAQTSDAAGKQSSGVSEAAGKAK